MYIVWQLINLIYFSERNKVISSFFLYFFVWAVLKARLRLRSWFKKIRMWSAGESVTRNNPHFFQNWHASWVFMTTEQLLALAGQMIVQQVRAFWVKFQILSYLVTVYGYDQVSNFCLLRFFKARTFIDWLTESNKSCFAREEEDRKISPNYYIPLS